MPLAPPPDCAFATLPPNTRGHDYFVGDIHGCFEALGRCLDAMGFRPDSDRLIAVGDLVDRGQRGDLAVQWLQRPYFHSIRGNHEGLYLGWRALRHDPAAQKAYEKELYFRKVNGGSWVQSVAEHDHQALEAALSRLPYFLTVPTPDGRRIGVVHAELPPGATWPRLLTVPATDPFVECFTWGRSRWRAHRKKEAAFADSNRIVGLDALVVGHVRVQRPLVLGNCVYLDTGGWADQGTFTIARADDVLAWVEDESMALDDEGDDLDGGVAERL